MLWVQGSRGTVLAPRKPKHPQQPLGSLRGQQAGRSWEDTGPYPIIKSPAGAHPDASAQPGWLQPRPSQPWLSRWRGDRMGHGGGQAQSLLSRWTGAPGSLRT